MSGITLTSTNVVSPLPIIPFNSAPGHEKFNEAKKANFTVHKSDSPLSISLLTQLSRVTNKEDKMIGQTAMCLMFNILQLTPFIFMREYTVPSPARTNFYRKLFNQEPILLSENDFFNFRITKEFFRKRPLIKDRGMTMEDVITLISNGLQFAVTKHYSASGENNQNEIRNKVTQNPINGIKFNADDTFLTNSGNLKNFISQQKKWKGQTGYLAFFDMKNIWPGQSRSIVAPIMAVNGDYALIMAPLESLQSQWVPINVLYKAMSRVDKRSTIPGGLVEIYMPYP